MKIEIISKEEKTLLFFNTLFIDYLLYISNQLLILEKFKISQSVDNDNL